MSRMYAECTSRILTGCAALLMGLIPNTPFVVRVTSLAAEAPPCNDEDVLFKVRRAYEFALTTDKSDHAFCGESVRETGYGGPNAWENHVLGEMAFSGGMNLRAGSIRDFRARR